MVAVLSFNNDTRNRTPNLNENSVVAQKNRNILERISFAFTVASSMSLAIIIAITWIAALRLGAIPSVAAWEQSGNAPWNHNGEMTAYVDYVFLASTMTLASGFAMAVLARSVGRRLLGGIAIAAAVVTMWYHFLLID